MIIQLVIDTNKKWKPATASFHFSLCTCVKQRRINNNVHPIILISHLP